MTEMSKAPTDSEILAAHEIAQARRARLTNARSLLSNATRGGRSLSQVKRADLARIMIALGGTVSTSTTRTAMVNFIEAADL